MIIHDTLKLDKIVDMSSFWAKLKEPLPDINLDDYDNEK